MRPYPRRSTSVSLAVLMLLALSACSQLPLGADGDLTNNWPAVSAPTGWAPKAGDCHHGFAETIPRAAYTVTNCDSAHSAQTFHVAEVTGAAAEAATSPAKNTDAYRALWSECDKQLTAFIGGQWQDRHIRPMVSLPGKSAWDAGVRWYSCVVIDFGAFDGRETFRRSLKDSFDTDPTLFFGCHQLPKDSSEATPKACTEPHNVEYVGHIPSTMTYEEMDAETEKEYDSFHTACQNLIAGFAKISTSAARRSGTWVWDPGKDAWEAGDRNLRCFLWLDKTSASKSLKGAGSSWPLR